MTRIVPLRRGIVDEWRGAFEEQGLFSDDAVRHLQSLIGDEHFMVVLTVMRERQPYSLVFRTLRTIQPAGTRLKEHLDESGRASSTAATFHHRPIDLRPLEDDPIISRAGSEPCTFAEALSHASALCEWNGCPVIYTHDDSVLGHG